MRSPQVPHSRSRHQEHPSNRRTRRRPHAMSLGLHLHASLHEQVEIKIEVLEEDDEDDIFDMEMTEHAADMATKLDALMDILFTFLFRESQKSISHQEQLFLMLLQLFDTFILKTHKSKYVQFLLFYMCAMNVNYTHVRSHDPSPAYAHLCSHLPPLRRLYDTYRRRFSMYRSTLSHEAPALRISVPSSPAPRSSPWLL